VCIGATTGRKGRRPGRLEEQDDSECSRAGLWKAGAMWGGRLATGRCQGASRKARKCGSQRTHMAVAVDSGVEISCVGEAVSETTRRRAADESDTIVAPASTTVRWW
jgi:hypothetical protein